MYQQPSLFPEQEPRLAERVDVDEMAAEIAAHARPVEYEDRTSEAARDQGHGSVELNKTEAPGEASKPSKLFELPGQNGRNNWYNRPLTNAEVRRAWSEMTPEEKAAQVGTNQHGAEIARQALRGAQVERDNES